MKKSLSDILPVPEVDGTEQGLRWRVAVPVGTNPFLLADVLVFAVLGAALVLFVWTSGLWFMEGLLSDEDLAATLFFSVYVFLGILGGFAVISFIALGNRYCALFRLEEEGVYHEWSRYGWSGRGKENGPESGQGAFFRARPYPAPGWSAGTRARSRYLAWSKVDRFRDYPTMRAIHLKREGWHMLRLYTPDDETHTRVTRYLEARLMREQ